MEKYAGLRVKCSTSQVRTVGWQWSGHKASEPELAQRSTEWKQDDKGVRLTGG